MCEHSYFLRYVLNIADSSGKAAQMGTAFHKIAECLGRGKLHYQQTGSKSCDVGDEYTGEILVEDIFDNKCFKDIVKACYLYYSSISDEKWTDKDLMTLMSLTKTLAEFQNGAFDPRNRTIFAIEKYFDIEIKEDWAKYTYQVGDKTIDGYLAIKGTIDILEEVDEHTLDVCDYKTGKKPYDWASGKDKTLADFQKDPQLLIYYYALKHLYPNKDIIFTVYYIKTGQPFTVCFDHNDYLKAEALIKKRFLKIKNQDSPQLISPTREKRESNFKCRLLCHYAKNKHPGTDISICEFFQEEIQNRGIEKVTEEHIDLRAFGQYQDGGGRKAESSNE